jgi:hypothetical protein
MGRYRGLIIVVVLIFSGTFLSSFAFLAEPGAADSPESDLKVAFLYNFLRFTEWPADRQPALDTPWVICALGATSFNRFSLEEVEQKNVAGRRIEFRRLQELQTVRECHVVFVSSSEDKNLPKVMTALPAKSILTVGETTAFGAAGGMVRFYAEGSQLRIEINLAQANQAGLKLSAKLLNVAKITGRSAVP